MKFIDTLKQPRWLIPICVLGYLIVMGIVAENQPWGRGWIHDLKYSAQCEFSRGSFNSGPSEYAVEFDIYEYPDEPSEEIQSLQQKIDQWIPEAIKTYPNLEVNNNSVPDDQNGFLMFIEWREEIDSLEHKWKYLDMPEDIKAISDALFSKEKNEAISNEQILAVETYLLSKKGVLDRALVIGLLPEQSNANIVPDRYMMLSLRFSKNIVDNLKLRALMEAKRGDFEAAFLTLKSIRGWGNHFGDVEAPNLIMTTLATAIHLGVQNTLHSQIIPLLLEAKEDLTPWAELTSYNNDNQKQRSRMWRGEWHFCMKALWWKQVLLDYNLRDIMPLLATYSSMVNDFADPEKMTSSASEMPSIPDHLTRKSQKIIELFLTGLEAFETGYLRAQAVLKQYELAFTLRKLESEGQDLKTLDQNTLDSLPLQILPGNGLTINFDERMISVPEDKFHGAEPLEF